MPNTADSPQISTPQRELKLIIAERNQKIASLLAPGGTESWNHRHAIACHREAVSRLQTELDALQA